tara:strand:- start:1173 stop:1658 length:486 start_codon:yes stop_codon:yes gene_type:complete
MATLTVTINESVTLNGRERGSEITMDVESITQVMHRIVSVPADGGSTATQTTIANFRTAVTTADSAIDDDDVRYARVTNLDATNAVTLNLQLAANGDTDASTNASVLLEGGKTFIINKAVGAAAVDDDAATAIVSLVDIESIIAVNDNNADVDIEVFVASV